MRQQLCAERTVDDGQRSHHHADRSTGFQSVPDAFEHQQLFKRFSIQSIVSIEWIERFDAWFNGAVDDATCCFVDG